MKTEMLCEYCGQELLAEARRMHTSERYYWHLPPHQHTVKGAIPYPWAHWLPLGNFWFQLVARMCPSWIYRVGSVKKFCPGQNWVRALTDLELLALEVWEQER